MSFQRETRAEDALSLLGTTVFVSFLRTVRDSPGCQAVRFANDALDAGSSIQDLLFTGEEFGYYLAVEAEPARRYVVQFGYAAGLAGDGANWRVTLDRNDEIVRVEMLEAWIH